MKRVLITGVGGFIGAHLLQYLVENTDWDIIGIDSWRHKGSLSRLVEVNLDPNRVKILTYDLSVPLDPQIKNLILNKRIDDRGNIVQDKIDYVINMASDSAVERSNENPVFCLTNNYNLAINMLEFAREVGVEKFIQISTDEVYGEALEGDFTEWSSILPSNPYAASKAAQEAVAICYWRTFELPVIITNSVNIIGEWQDNEKFLPKIIEKVAKGLEMPIYGDSESEIGSRFYLDAQNKASALKFILDLPTVSRYDSGKGSHRPDRFHISSDIELNNLEFAQKIAAVMKKELKYKLIPVEKARAGCDRRYGLNDQKLRSLGWKPPIGFEETLERIVSWTLQNPHWI